jgi:hypothetical protein
VSHNNSLVLAVDGSGVASFKHPSKEFCISGIITTTKNLTKINSRMSNVCKKYFSDPDVVLHFTEISRKIGIFDSLKDPLYETGFWSDIISVIENKEIMLVYGLADKDLIKSRGWQQITLAERCYHSVIKNFFRILIKLKLKGQIVTESDLYTDDALIKIHNKFQSEGIPILRVSSKKYHQTVTSLSLVNKYNLDSLVQLADLLGNISRKLYRVRQNKDESCDKLQLKLIRLIERKIKRKEAFYEVI